MNVCFFDGRDELKIAYDENGTPYMLEALGSEAEHISRLLSAEQDNRLIELPKDITPENYGELTEVINRVL